MISPDLVVVGCGWNVWEELDGIPLSCDFMAVNDIGCYLPKVDHWYSALPDALEIWAKVRQFRYDDRPKFWSPQTHPFDHVGSSGYLACRVGQDLGYSRILAVGIPLDDGGHWFGGEPQEQRPDFRRHRWWTGGRSGLTPVSFQKLGAKAHS